MVERLRKAFSVAVKTWLHPWPSKELEVTALLNKSRNNTELSLTNSSEVHSPMHTNGQTQKRNGLSFKHCPKFSSWNESKWALTWSQDARQKFRLGWRSWLPSKLKLAKVCYSSGLRHKKMKLSSLVRRDCTEEVRKSSIRYRAASVTIVD